MNESKPFKHGEEGTHNVCNKHNIGGKSVCCECSGKDDCGDEPMTNTEKILAEFRKLLETIKTDDTDGFLAYDDSDELGVEIELVESFLTTKLHQAEQEIEVKVRLEIFQMLHKRIMETKDLNQIDILELLQKELLDNLKE